MTQGPGYDFQPVTDRLGEGEIGNLFIPGHAGSEAGADGTDEAAVELNRRLAVTAAEFFLSIPETERGFIVCSDGGSEPAEGPDPRTTVWDGLIRHDVPESAIKIEMNNLDPVTNFMRAQALFESNAAVGIVSPAGLWSMHRAIAERTMRRYHGGLVVESPDDGPDKGHGLDAFLARYVAVGQTPTSPDIMRAQKRAVRAHRWVRRLGLAEPGHRQYGASSRGWLQFAPSAAES